MLAALGSSHDLALGTWNGNGLFCCSDFDKMQRKVKLVRKILRSCKILCLQETHGDWCILRKQFRLELRNFWFFASFGARNVGGIVTFVSKDLVPDHSDISDTVLSVGRAHRISINKNDAIMTIFNVHYFGLPRVDITRLCGSLTADADASAADPLNFVSFALGDWNLRQGLKFDYKNPSAPIQTDNSIAGDPLLRGALGRYTELDGQLPTRYSDVEDCARKLDTIFTSLPSALIPLSRWSVTIPYDPKNLFRSGLSDHAPVVAFGFHSGGTIPGEPHSA